MRALTAPTGRQLIIAAAAIGALGPFGMHTLLPALPAIAADFRAAPATIQWTISLSLVAIALGNLLVAPLSDRYGRRPVTITGLVLYLLGSLAGSLAGDVATLVVARCVQAFGAGAAMAVARASLSDFFGLERSASALASTATVVLLVPMLAPTLGGFTVEWLGWRHVFTAALAVGALVTAFTLFGTRETHAADRGAGAPLRSFASYRQLLGHREYLGHVFYGAAMMGSVTVFITSAPYVAIEVYGVKPSTYGLLFMLPALASFSGFFFTSRMAGRLGAARMMRMGTTLTCLGGLALLTGHLAGLEHPLAVLIPGMLVCAANALSAPNSTASAIRAAPNVAGAASGLLGFTQLLVGAIATQLVAFAAHGTATPLVVAILCLNLAAALLLRANRRVRARGVSPT